MRSLVTCLLAAGCFSHAVAAELSVGSDAACTHPDLQAALATIAGIGGDHLIRVKAGVYAVPDGMRYAPQVTQGTLRIEGGQPACGPQSGAGLSILGPARLAGRSVFDGKGGLARSVLELQLDGRLARVELRGMVLQGGDAIDPARRFDQGGGLAVFGDSVVLLGAGTRIVANRAGHGGGVALAGSRIDRDETLQVATLLVDEKAEIVSNDALGDGGGIYCGGSAGGTAPAVFATRHGSIVLRSGRVSANRAGQSGAGIYCQGSYAAGGVRPWPRPGSVFDVSANTGVPGSSISGRCAITGTLDLFVPPNAAGEYAFGADEGSDGLLRVADNIGSSNSGLCLYSWQTRGGASPAPATPPRLVLRNAWFIGNRVERFGPPGLTVHTSALHISGLDLHLRPAAGVAGCGPALEACVLFESNQASDAIDPDPGPVLRSGYFSRLRVSGARIRANHGHRAILWADDGGRLELESSIADLNLATGSEGTLATAWGQHVRTSISLVHNTIVGNTLVRFLKLFGSSQMTLQGNVLQADGNRLLAFVEGSPTKVLLRWCNHLDRLDDPVYVGASRESDGLGPLLTQTGPIAFGADYAPTAALVDRCRTPVDATGAPLRDHRGQSFGLPQLPGAARPADLGAVEGPAPGTQGR